MLGRPDATASPPRLVGTAQPVACLDGSRRPYVNLDYAASTPALQCVWEAVQEFIPWYSSVHRGSGLKSQLATAALEGAREAVAQFVGASADHTVIFASNTTMAINVLSAAVPPETVVISSLVEHHANMLPWRGRASHVQLPVCASPAELLEACRVELEKVGRATALVAVTGASNVTGEVWPIEELATLAHSYDAEILVDAAQLAPHRPIDMGALGIDHLALSGHKLYAPFGSGALVARRTSLCGEPLIKGGGAIKFVTASDVVWAESPERYEAGSPNVVGAVALGAACDSLAEFGLEKIAASERLLCKRVRSAVSRVPGVRLLGLWDDGVCDRVGVATFVVDEYRHSLVGAVLSAEHAIGVRSGCFCAHPLLAALLEIEDDAADVVRVAVASGATADMPGAVRASLGLDSTVGDVDRLEQALRRLVEVGPQADYVYDIELDEHRPYVDHRDWPDLTVRLQRTLDGERGCGN